MLHHTFPRDSPCSHEIRLTVAWQRASHFYDYESLVNDNVEFSSLRESGSLEVPRQYASKVPLKVLAINRFKQPSQSARRGNDDKSRHKVSQVVLSGQLLTVWMILKSENDQRTTHFALTSPSHHQSGLKWSYPLFRKQNSGLHHFYQPRSQVCTLLCNR